MQKKTFYPNNLCDDYSPTIPPQFPKERLPRNFSLFLEEICESSYLKLLKCGLIL